MATQCASCILSFVSTVFYSIIDISHPTTFRLQVDRSNHLTAEVVVVEMIVKDIVRLMLFALYDLNTGDF